jgi:alanine dehydrogenase
MVKISLMVIGVPREVKAHEYRVAVTPEGVMELKADGHRVLVEASAGTGSGFSDGEYLEAGAEVADRERLFAESDLVVKVKEPVREEFGLLPRGKAIFTFLHLAPNPGLTDLLLEKEIAAFAYETLEDGGRLALLSPMSEIAGRMSPLVASYFLQKTMGGSGLLPSGTAGVLPANMLIIGAGVVGTNAARISLAVGMRVTVLNRDVERLRLLDEMFGGRLNTLPSTMMNLGHCLRDADIVVAAVLLPGQKAPRLITRRMLSEMRSGSVIVDVSIDQGGCAETSRPTTHDDPVYEVDGIIHYAVSNMPGAYPRTSTMALTTRTLPYIRTLARLGPERAAREDPALRSALNTYGRKIIHGGLALSTGREPGEI